MFMTRLRLGFPGCKVSWVCIFYVLGLFCLLLSFPWYGWFCWTFWCTSPLYPRIGQRVFHLRVSMGTPLGVHWRVELGPCKRWIGLLPTWRGFLAVFSAKVMCRDCLLGVVPIHFENEGWGRYHVATCFCPALQQLCLIDPLWCGRPWSIEQSSDRHHLLMLLHSKLLCWIVPRELSFIIAPIWVAHNCVKHVGGFAILRRACR